MTPQPFHHFQFAVELEEQRVALRTAIVADMFGNLSYGRRPYFRSRASGSSKPAAPLRLQAETPSRAFVSACRAFSPLPETISPKFSGRAPLSQAGLYSSEESPSLASRPVRVTIPHARKKAGRAAPLVPIVPFPLFAEGALAEPPEVHP
jgi:hypothetical protein